MKLIYCLICISLLSYDLKGQQVKIPSHYKLNKAEDYAPYKDSVSAVCNWLINTPMDGDVIRREEANKFVFRWISGAPHTSIEIRPEFTNDIMADTTNKYSRDILMLYIVGMTLAKLENNDIDQQKTQEAGVRAMLKGYKTIRRGNKNEFLEKLLKLEKKGKLSDWIKDNMVKYPPKDKAKIIPKD